ncbi:hypothetical protein M1432_00210 [Patescibacteria group bacterium]|nr:hypothetical protein [Patescibacteria group bacterium]
MENVFFLNGKTELIVLEDAPGFNALWRNDRPPEYRDNPWQGNPVGVSRGEFEHVDLDSGITVEHRRGTMGIFDEFLVLRGSHGALDAIYDDLTKRDKN